MKNKSMGGRIAFIQANWHSEIVGQARQAFVEELGRKGISSDKVDIFDVPGSLEIPLQAKMLAKTGDYDIIVGAGMIVDGGIYRHEFVAGTVIDAIMQVQLETEVPILSVILTPQNFHEHDAHAKFFFEHFTQKGREAANACVMTLENMRALRQPRRAA